MGDQLREALPRALMAPEGTPPILLAAGSDPRALLWRRHALGLLRSVAAAS